MLAHRLNQENVVHGQQTTKPLNGAKTPATKAPKTPFGKSILRPNGQENVATIGKKGLQLERDAFVTPAGTKTSRICLFASSRGPSGPRNRAPLGFKTTNAKAAALQTPIGKYTEAVDKNHFANSPHSDKNVPLKTVQKTAENPYARRKRASVRSPTTAKAQSGDVYPDEVEYMPPRIDPLPDVPSDDDFDIRKACELLKSASLSHVFYHPLDEEEAQLQAEKREMQLKEDLQKAEDEVTRAAEADLDLMEQEIREELGLPRARPTKLPSRVGTAKAKEASSALSQSLKKIAPSYAAPTASSKAHRRPGSSDGNTSHAIAIAASRSTVSYGKGRRVSNKLKQPAKNDTALVAPSNGNGSQAGRRDMSTELDIDTESEEHPLADPLLWADSDEEVFQFQLPTLH